MKRIYIFNTLLIIVLLCVYLFQYRTHTSLLKPISVGVLFSSSGTMAGSEAPVKRATLLAIKEINEQGGIHGRLLIPVVYDPASKTSAYGVLAQKMILSDEVNVIFGCWTSVSRQLVKSMVERYNNLLVYPTQTEGVEESSHIIYLGATPNQQVVPAIYWMFEHYGKRVYFVGSNYISPYVIQDVMHHYVLNEGGELVGSRYLPLGSLNIDAIVNDIIQSKPDFIFNIFNGSTNEAFFNRLYALTVAKGIKRPPVVSFSLSALTIERIGMYKMLGDFVAWTYFLTDDNPKNHAFLAAYKKEYGSIDDVNDPAATAYAGVYLWAQAAKQAPSLEGHVVHDLMLNQSIASPAGVIYVDPSSAYAWRTVEIAKINAHGTYDLVWLSGSPIEPIVYPDFKTKMAWHFFEYQYDQAQAHTQAGRSQ